MLAVPLVGLTEVMINGSPSGSLSLTNTGIVTGVSSGVLAKSLTATGGSFTGVTVTVTMALALRLPSLFVYPRVVVPTKLADGRKTRFVPTMLTVPLVGVAEMMVNASPFGSESLTNTGI